MCSGHIGYNLDMPSYYTRTGDGGSTGILGEGRLPKNHPRIEALGVLDEVTAALGLSRALSQAPQTKPIILEIQRDLYALMAEIAATTETAGRFRTLESQRVQWLESVVDGLSSQVPAPSEFILPGDSLSGAALALSRTIVRRAERQVVALFDTEKIQNSVILQYMNRLSTVCFILELLENQFTGHETTLAKR